MAKQKTTTEIKKLLKETKHMKGKDAAKHIGISLQTLYKWKVKAKTSPKTKGPLFIPKNNNKKALTLIKDLKAKLVKLEAVIA